MTGKRIERQEWRHFRASGLVWWVNRLIHLFDDAGGDEGAGGGSQ